MAEEVDVWSKLPHEVMESIFSRLSVYDFVRAGCTCTRLRAFISSRRFIPSSSVSLLLLTHPFEVPFSLEPAHFVPSAWAYDRTRDGWLKLSLAFLQPELPDFAYPVASAEGLLCFGSGGDFVVCNPITRSCRRLPTLPRLFQTESGDIFQTEGGIQIAFDEHSEQACGLICNPSTGTYEFFIMHFSALGFGMVVAPMHYSSSVSQWRGIPPHIMREHRSLYSNKITPCNSSLYTLWQKGDHVVVVAYCDGVWSEIKSPVCTSTLVKAALLDVHGSLHVVGAGGSIWIPEDVLVQPTCVCIWELNVDSGTWREVTRMPAAALQEVHSFTDCDILDCWGKNGVVYMKSSWSDVLTCDLCRNEWKWLKDLEIDVDVRGLIFEPSLSALA